MELSAITSNQIVKHKDDSVICGEVIGWSTSDFGLTQKITIRKCVNEEFIEETFDAKDLILETFDAKDLILEADSKKSQDFKAVEQWLTIFYKLNPKDNSKEIDEEVMSHTKLVHNNKAKAKDINEILIREILTSPFPPHLNGLQDTKQIRVWSGDKSYIGDFSIERVINLIPLKVD